MNDEHTDVKYEAAKSDLKTNTTVGIGSAVEAWRNLPVGEKGSTS